ncbi:MAG: CHASE2 domain-containing protein [Phormidesmis sp.]
MNEGSLTSGFLVTLLMGEEGAVPSVDISGRLPAAPHLQSLYQQWQVAYRHLGAASRLERDPVPYATNVSRLDDCGDLADRLCAAFNQWLHADSFRPIHDKLLEHLNAADAVRLILQTEPGIVQRLPWHLWEICDRYPRLEITLSAVTYERHTPTAPSTRSTIRILAIIGQSQGIDLKTDRDLLDRLPNAEVHFVIEPDLQTLSDRLWEPAGWDILFFAGHSATKSLRESVQASLPEEVRQTNYFSPPTNGELYVSAATPLILSSLKNPLKKAVERGLKIAIFNSCDGLGLAYALADLQISQILVMREPVPDVVAHRFLQSFLDTFSRGESLALSVHEAREKLQSLEDEFPCASWLPTLYQNPAEEPPTWQTLRAPAPQKADRQYRLVGAAYVVTTVLLLLLRAFGFFQPSELRAFDRLMGLRPRESADSRLALVTVTDADLQAQDPEDRRGSLADGDLLQLLTILNQMGPRTIGLDIYRDYPARANQPELASALATQSNLFGVCKSRDIAAGSEGIPPAPEMVNSGRVGFSDYLTDPDGVVRKQLISLRPDPVSPCRTEYGLAMLLTLHYLSTMGIAAEFTDSGELKLDDKVLLKPFDRNDGGYVNSPDQGWQMLLNYRSLPRLEEIAEQITLTEILSGKVSPEWIRDRIVIIGSTASGFDDDRWLTPYSKGADKETRGVVMQAHMVSQLLSAVLDDRPFIQTWPLWGNVLWIGSWAGLGSLLMIAIASGRNHFLAKLLLGLLVSEVALFGLCWLLLSRACLWVPWVPAAIAPVAVATTTYALRRSSLLLNRSSSTTALPNFLETSS